MTKTLPQRIAYFTKKVAQKGAVHPSKLPPRSHKYRHKRLMQYKAAMHKLMD